MIFSTGFRNAKKLAVGEAAIGPIRHDEAKWVESL